MSRTVNTAHRQALLVATSRHLVDHGIADQSLSDIATGVGASARMLIHHFGTRDALIAGALAKAREWQLEEATRHFQSTSDAVAVLRASWTWLIDDETLRFFRLFQQVAALERLQAPEASANFSARLGEDWRPLIKQVFATDPRYADSAESFADLTIAVYRGLAIELVQETGHSPHRRTFERFIGLVRASAVSRTPSR